MLEQARGRLQIVVEITERHLVEDPAGLLHAVRQIRGMGWGVVLDDVGADPASLALMPFIEPDVIKLDLRLIQQRTTAEVATIVNAVNAQAERSAAIVLAEGIETQEHHHHHHRALAMGATLGQGWLLGRPAPLPDATTLTRNPVDSAYEHAFVRDQQDFAATPFELVWQVRPVRTATKDLLLPLSHHLERHALTAHEAPVLLWTFEDASHFTPGTAARYERLATRCAFTGALGVGMTATPVAGVRGAELALDDRLSGEWVVCAIGPHFAGALVAKDLGDQGPDRQRRFDFAVTYDRDLVLGAATSLFTRMSAQRRPSELDAAS